MKHTGHGLAGACGNPGTALVEYHKPAELVKLLDFQLPETGGGKSALLDVIQKVLKYSVNTWDQGFLDKLYASTNAVCPPPFRPITLLIVILQVGVAAELILATLNTNVRLLSPSPIISLTPPRSMCTKSPLP